MVLTYTPFHGRDLELSVTIRCSDTERMKVKSAVLILNKVTIDFYSDAGCVYLYYN